MAKDSWTRSVNIAKRYLKGESASAVSFSGRADGKAPSLAPAGRVQSSQSNHKREIGLEYCKILPTDSDKTTMALPFLK